VVFLDEPMSGLDPIGRREIRELIADLRAQGKTVFMSTHILSDIEALCDEVAILRKGKLAAHGKLDELLMTQQDGQGFEITVGNIDPDALPSIPASEILSQPSGSIIRCDHESDVVDILSAVRANGGRLISVEPVKRSLEDLFTSQTDQPAE